MPLGFPVHRFPAGFGDVNDTTLVMDASGEKIAFCGYFWHPERATKTVDGIEFLTGAITDSGGSITTSIQNVSLTAGAPMRPDEGTPLVSLADRDLGLFTASGWNGFDFGASSSIAFGQLIAAVWEFGTGFTTDVFRIGGVATAANTPGHSAIANLKAGAGPSWLTTGTTIFPNVVFRCSDGSFGTLFGGLPCVSSGLLTFNSGSAGFDEIALGIRLPVPFTIESIFAGVDMDSDTNIIVYDGTTALYTRLLDNSERASVNIRYIEVPLGTLQALSKDTLYRIALQPNTTTNIVVRYIDINEAGHAALVHGCNAYTHYWDRLNAGAWSNETTTRIPYMGVTVAQCDDAAGGGGAINPLNGLIVAR